MSRISHRSRMGHRLIAAVTVVFAAAGMTAPPAAAGGYGIVDCRRDPTNPQCVITVSVGAVPGSPAGPGGACRSPIGAVLPCYVQGAGWYGGDGCYYQPATGADLAVAETLGGVATPPARWYVGHCGYPPVATLTRLRLFATPPGPALLAGEAVRALRLPAPVIRMNPAAPAPQLVFVATWLWLDPAGYRPRAATASVPGLSVTATATPTTVTWSMGDGTTVTCAGPGTAWTPGTDPAAASPTCGHTYTHAVGPDTITVRASITWTVSWAGGGASGVVPAVTSTATIPVRVAAAPTVITGGGRR